jgi:hypothetical protein
MCCFIEAKIKDDRKFQEYLAGHLPELRFALRRAQGGRPFKKLDSVFHWKLLLRFRYFRHPWRSRRSDGNGVAAIGPLPPKNLTLSRRKSSVARME